MHLKNSSASLNRVKNQKIVIRDAHAEEAPRVALVLRAAYTQYKSEMPPDAWQYYLADIMDVRARMKESQLIVAEVEGNLAGTVTLYTHGRSQIEGNWPEGWGGVRLLGVDPKYRGMGLGRMLMDECMRRCRAEGMKTVGLHTAPMMAVAKAMYERMGFQHVPEFDHHPRPGVTIMAYKLDL